MNSREAAATLAKSRPSNSIHSNYPYEIMQNFWNAGERKMIRRLDILGAHFVVPGTAKDTQTVS